MVLDMINDVRYKGGPSIEEVRGRVKGDTIHKLSSNENPRGPSPMVLAAIRKTAADLNLYAPRDDKSLRASLVDFHGRGLTDDHFTSAAGGVEMLELIARTFLTAGDEVIICPPAFGWYVRSASRQRVNIVSVPLEPEAFSHDIPAILAAVTEKTRLIYICNPHNPTGAMVSAAEMAHLLDYLPAHVLVIADDVYHHFVSRSDYPDSIQYILEERNIIRVESFSKAYGLAGLRLGYALGPPPLIAQIRRQRRPFHASSLTLAAGSAALADQAYVNETVALVQAGREYLYERLEALGVRYWPSQGNFVLIQPAMAEETLNDLLLERGIMIRPTKNNGLPGAFRVTIGLPAANEAFIQALTEILEGAQIL